MLTLDSLQTRLSQLDSSDALRYLFADWSYDVDFSPVFLGQATKADERAHEHLAAQPEIVARSGEFEIIYAPLKEFQKRGIGAQRLVISRLLSTNPFALWIFSDEECRHWHFVNVKRGGKTVKRGDVVKTRHVLRRISVTSGRKPGRTICERLSKLDLQGISPSLFGLGALEIQAAHDAAFDVEAVTASFYKGYRRVVRELQMTLRKQHNNAEWAHALSLQTLNRMMFLRFITTDFYQGFDS